MPHIISIEISIEIAEKDGLVQIKLVMMQMNKMSVDWCRKHLGADAQEMTDKQVEQYRDMVVQLVNTVLNKVLI